MLTFFTQTPIISGVNRRAAGIAKTLTLPKADNSTIPYENKKPGGLAATH